SSSASRAPPRPCRWRCSPSSSSSRSCSCGCSVIEPMSSAPSRAPGERARRARRARRGRRWADRLVLYVMAAISFVVLAGPLLWMLSSSLKGPGEVLASPPTLFPHEVRWQNYRDVFGQVPFARYMLNSLLVAGVVTVVALLFHSMAAYSLARLRFPGRDRIFLGILTTLMVPFTVITVPLFIIVDWLGWVDSYLGLIVPMIPHAFGIFVLQKRLVEGVKLTGLKG